MKDDYNSRRKTIDGVPGVIYNTQLFTSRKRRDPLPDYTVNELRRWMQSQQIYHKLHTNWVKSGYKLRLKPSCDRLNDYKPYTLDNLRIVTWGENKDKGHRDRRNGINNKASKAVIGVHKRTKRVIEFVSMMEAERRTGILNNQICECCKKKKRSGGGYIWRYKNKNKS